MTAILGLLGLLAAGALFASDMPREWAWAATPLVLLYAAWAARREWRRPWRSLMLPPAVSADAADGQPPALLDDAALAEVEVVWRGRSGFLRCRGLDGRLVRAVVWSDVTTAHARRELRLALRDRATSPSRPSMAP